MSKIYYLIPDLFKPSFNITDCLRSAKQKKLGHYVRTKVFPKHKAVGGVKVMYQHCLMLREKGVDANPLLMGNYQGNFFGYDLEFYKASQVKDYLSSNDVVVSTEFEPYDGLKFERAKKVLFMQNWINLERRLKPEDKSKSYLDLGYDYVITCGDYCSEMVEQKMGIKPTTITNGIDQVKFCEKPEKRVSGRVLVLSRKNYQDFEKIKSICGADVDFRVVDSLTQDELINEYQQADIFLATGYPEGLPLPPLEAMNCGCAVVGFTGGGAKEYMIDTQTAMVADDGDCDVAAQKLLQLLGDKNLKEKIREAGCEKAREYTLAKTSEALVAFYNNIIT